MKKITLGIIDYGIGNLKSIKNSLLALGYRVIVSKIINELESTDLIILPGVGAFKPAIQSIEKEGLDIFIKDWFYQNKPIIGICLGMQLLAESSEENGLIKGLDLIPGKVSRIDPHKTHIGWNNTRLFRNNPYVLKPDDNQNFFFNHAYAYPIDTTYTILESKFIDKNFSSVISQKKLIGFQFHPEKSQLLGKKVLKISIDNLCHA